jgi:hypothetical protein
MNIYDPAYIVCDSIVTQIKGRNHGHLHKRLGKRNDLRIRDIFLAKIHREQFLLTGNRLVDALNTQKL